jgi:hypothetical protein
MSQGNKDSNQKMNVDVDIAIFGGGIAGLWALNRLRKAGFNAVLFEAKTLGGGQTIKSQGIIHGGIKFALTGVLTGASQAIANMPTRWKECLQGTGEIDLSRVNILSQEQLLWSTGSLTSDITSFFASKALKARVQKLKPEAYPTLLQHAQFKGKVYRLEEVVLDSPSLIAALAAPLKDFIFKVDPKSLQFNFDQNNPGYVSEVCISNIQAHGSNAINATNAKNVTTKLKLHAKRYLLTAGEGNQAISQGFTYSSTQGSTHSASQGFTHTAAQQCRPLQMVVVKLEKAYPLFAHCLDNGMNPRVTITSHTAQDGKAIWYIGGQLAEDGIHRTPNEQIAAAKKELNALFPWLDLQNAQWASFYINRAEPKQPDGKRPDLHFLQTQQNIMTAWPTKLALAPLLVDNLLKDLADQGISPEKTHANLSALNVLEKPEIAKPVWDEIFDDCLKTNTDKAKTEITEITEMALGTE